MPVSAAPLPCLPGTAAYPPGTCHYKITQFGYPISLTTSGDPAEFVVVFGDPAQSTVGFGARFFFYFGPAQVAATSTSVDAQGQMVGTFKKSAVPAGSNTLTVRQADRPRHPPPVRRATGCGCGCGCGSESCGKPRCRLCRGDSSG